MLGAPFAFLLSRGAMIGSTSAERLVDVRDNSHRPPFLASHRAVAACARELARLSEEIVLGAVALSSTTVEHKAVVRQSPDRCIVQLGPVALTLAWLRSSNDSVAAGELLVIVWRGAVAPRKELLPERRSTRPAPLPATALWEQVLTAVADSEQTWAWQPRAADLGRCSSTELAARCVERLRVAYLESDQESPTSLKPETVSVA
jgi:hypothetical protein